MDSFDTQRRRLIDGLVRELVALASELSAREVTRALAEQREQEKKTPKVSPRLARALERAEERRRLAAERRAAKLAARPVGRRARVNANADAGSAPSVRSSRQPAPLLPPPLFVHKRSRDGSIQKLERTAADGPPPSPA
jgi:hypothetical protein